MHGLQSIRTMNEQAVRHEFNHALQRIKSDGYSYRIARDPVTGEPDPTAPVTMFATASALRTDTLATVPANALDSYVLYYGSK